MFVNNTNNDTNGGGYSVALLLVIIILILAVYFVVWKKKTNNKKGTHSLNDNVNDGNIKQSDKKDEIWRAIKQFLWNNDGHGQQIVYTYSIKRPHPSQLHKRLKEARIFQAKQEAKSKKIRYKKPKLPQKFPLEDYFLQLANETYQISLSQKQQSAGVTTTTKEHRQKKNKPKKVISKLITKFINFLPKRQKINLLYPPHLLDRDLYVLIFQTKNAKHDKLNNPRAIEVEIIKKTFDKNAYERKIIINKELNLLHELAWILPQKTADDKAHKKEQKENILAAEKSQKRAQQKQKIKQFFLTFISKIKIIKKKNV